MFSVACRRPSLTTHTPGSWRSTRSGARGDDTSGYFLRGQIDARERELDEVQLAHEELEYLTACDRASTTRALHKMEQEGFIQLRYRCIRLLPALDNLENPQANTP